ncbi:MAG: TetR/AcrR family transcriptional regulator [Clostridiales bacterium]|nr:TetR/AcrR family transcriptional regulator [Clostridiales bacterium]
MNANDPRVKRTKQLIQQTFLELMKEKGFDAITIQDIASRSTINRSTFYAHYTDKYALLEELTELAFEKTLPEETVQAKEFTSDVCGQLVKSTYEYIVAFYKKCRFSNKSFANQIDGKVKHLLRQMIHAILDRSKMDCDANIASSMISSAIYSAAYCWHEGNGSDDIKPLSDAVTSFILKGLKK